MYALFITHNGRDGHLYSDHNERVVIACGKQDLFALRILASSLRNDSSAHVVEVELIDYAHDVVCIQRAA